jgi:glycyl-tRNA synthetase alpha chain
MRHAEELEFSVYDFEDADPAICRSLLDLYEGEAARLLSGYPRNRNSNKIQSVEQDRGDISSNLLKQRFPLRKAYDLCLKCSHLFNILDARGAISVTERVALIARVRKLACGVAAIYLDRLALTEAQA